jgi:hypothetical protein
MNDFDSNSKGKRNINYQVIHNHDPQQTLKLKQVKIL